MKKLLYAFMIFMVVAVTLAAIIIPLNISFLYAIELFGDKQHAVIFLLCYDVILSIISVAIGTILIDKTNKKALGTVLISVPLLCLLITLIYFVVSYYIFSR